MYSIRQYGSMYLHASRMIAYSSALGRFINPNSVVLDIGTGTGIFALLACQYGAWHVYAVEPDESAYANPIPASKLMHG